VATGVAALDRDAIEARLAAMRQPVSSEEALPVADEHAPTERRKIGDSARSWLRVAQNPDQRFMLGLEPIDVLTRGFGPRELVFLTGFAHSGKTQLVNTAIVNNRDARILFFSLDDPGEMIAIKLLSMVSGIDAEELESLARSGDVDVLNLIDQADSIFPNLWIVDQPLSFGAMEREVEAATREWGAPPHAVAFEFLGLIPNGDGGSDAGAALIGKAQSAKRWAKDCDWPTLLLHQGTRGQCPPGKPVTITSMAYGGEAEATMMLGARRKSMDEDLDDHDRRRHAHTVTLHVVKNKRPPGRKTSHEGIDFYIDPGTGLIRPLKDGDVNLNAAADAARRAALIAHAPREVQAFARAFDGSEVEVDL
jgi:hypothetical protein